MASLASLSSINSPSGRGANALSLILTKSLFLQYMESQSGYELDATNFRYRTYVPGSSLKVRPVGTGYSATALTPTAEQIGSLAFLGDSVTIDVTYQRDADKKLNTVDMWLQGELRERMVSYGPGLEIQMFNGSGASNNMKGLKNILNGTDDVPGFTGHKGVVNAKTYQSGSAVSFDMTTVTAAQAAKFKEMMNLVIGEVDNPTAIVCNRAAAGRITTFADALKVASTNSDYAGFGSRVKEYDGIPIIVLNDGAILNDEPDDTSGSALTNTTSIYVMGVGEGILSQATNSGLYYQDYDSPTNEQKNQEWWEYAGQWKVASKNSVRRIRNLKIV